MAKVKMTIEKAQKHLKYAREHLKYWQEAYVDVCRDKNRTLDIKLHLAEGYETIRDMKKAEAIAEMKEAKVRIARFERITR